MNEENIIKQVSEKLLQSLNGQEVENNKFDFKREWYNLKENKGINEFLKDVTSIANSYGPDGFIVLGYDEKKQTFLSAVFSDNKLRDKSDIYGLITKRTSNVFDLNFIDIDYRNNPISVIHIPPSMDKPILIKEYQTFDSKGNLKKRESQKIFVRKNSGTYEASKHDLDLMYYDRKNIEPDYLINITPISIKRHSPGYGGKEKMQFVCNVENLGRKPIAFHKYGLTIHTSNDEIFEYMADSIWRESGKSYTVGQFTEKVYASSVQDIIMDFKIKDKKIFVNDNELRVAKGEINEATICFYTTNGKEYFVDLKKSRLTKLLPTVLKFK